ncbi:MAG: 30S ribosomal protein S18 [Christensenellales bacterium]
MPAASESARPAGERPQGNRPYGDRPQGDRPSYERRERRGGGRGGRRPRRKVCAFCVDKVSDIDYKDLNRLRRFLTERGKIMPRRMSGSCAKHQRQLAMAIKKARVVALLPYTME